MDTYAFLTVRATLPNPHGQAIEIACLKLDHGVQTAFYSRVRPEKPLTDDEKECSGLDERIISALPSRFDVAKSLLSFVEDAVLVGVGVNYDINYLTHGGGLGELRRLRTLEASDVQRRLFDPPRSSEALARRLGLYDERMQTCLQTECLVKAQILREALQMAASSGASLRYDDLQRMATASQADLDRVVATIEPSEWAADAAQEIRETLQPSVAAGMLGIGDMITRAASIQTKHELAALGPR